jgi:hypothetical protein
MIAGAETAMSVQPAFNVLYIHDTADRVLCGECLSNEFECWPDDWSEVPVAAHAWHACDNCAAG